MWQWHCFSSNLSGQSINCDTSEARKGSFANDSSLRLARCLLHVFIFSVFLSFAQRIDCEGNLAVANKRLIK